MPEMRQDPISGHWVIMAPDRSTRPHAFASIEEETFDEFDPFAEGHEAETPPEILACRCENSEPNGPGWNVRVVPNKFPAVTDDEVQSSDQSKLFPTAPATGVHEVIIEGPGSEARFARLPQDIIRNAFWAYRERMRFLKQQAKYRHAIIFKNQGRPAGASLMHCHSQLMATHHLPATIERELAGSEKFFETDGECIFEAMISKELSLGLRIVSVTESFVVFCPFASRVPFETWIVPRFSQSHFEAVSDDRLAELADVARNVLRRIDEALHLPPLNFYLHSAPFDYGSVWQYRWHWEILPRLTQFAGYEWGSGTIINSVSPEFAAEQLRKVDH